MTETAIENVTDEVEGAGGVPWHYWAVAGISLLWNAFPAIDFTLTQLRLDGWGDPAMLSAVHAAPWWATLGWALGGYGGLLGAIALLLRSRLAVHGFAASILGACISFAWQYSAGLVATPVVPVIIVASQALLLWYSRAMRAAGVLR